jgi:beta-lactamase superfamily II metal-dependent hydrolase
MTAVDHPLPLVRVWFVDVGAGDCTLVLDMTTRRALLVDCPSNRVDKVYQVLDAEGASLDTVIVTHWDIDHYGGAARLAIDLKVNKVLYNHDTLFVSDDSPGHLIRTTLKNFLNVPFGQEVLGSAAAGQQGSIGELSWRILAPTYADLTKAYVARRRNIASAVVEIKIPNLRILIGGDAVGATWERLLIDGGLKSDVLRWPHHGADLAGDRDGSIRDEVLAAVDPSLVVISTGATNPHGHPSELIAARAARATGSLACTQVTAGCFGFPSRISRKSDEAQTLMLGHKDEPCAGTILIDCWETSHRVSPSPSERAARIATWPHPMCMKAMASQ